MGLRASFLFWLDDVHLASCFFHWHIHRSKSELASMQCSSNSESATATSTSKVQLCPLLDAIADKTEQAFGFRPCTWQAEVGAALLQQEKDVMCIAKASSGKTLLTFWMPLLFKNKSTRSLSPHSMCLESRKSYSWAIQHYQQFLSHRTQPPAPILL